MSLLVPACPVKCPLGPWQRCGGLFADAGSLGGDTGSKPLAKYHYCSYLSTRQHSIFIAHVKVCSGGDGRPALAYDMRFASGRDKTFV